ncbi:MAG: SprB repeat-containing protein, partial [Bacteroidia bacterium]|nr:SprB repeat-containing protein [Bacteroidia bacterium]
MKKFLVKAFCFLSFITSVNSNYAQCSQDQVGAINYSVTSQFSDMAVAPNGLLYSFAYNSGVGKFYLHSISAPSSSWTPVANINGSTSTKPVIQVSKTGKVYVALKDDAAGQVGKLFYLSGATFIQLGSPFSGANKVSDLSIALNSLGEEYVAYTDITNGNRSTVKKWDGSSWINVGTGTVSINSGYYNSLIIDKTDAPVLAFQDLNSGNKITVMKFNGTSWNFSTSVGSSPTNARLKLGQNGDYYLGYTEDTNNGVVQKFNGSSWSQLGSSIPNLSPTSNAFDLDLDPNDMPYIIALNNTSFYAVAFRYTGSWSNVFGGNISGVTTVNTNVAVDYKGTPYFFYVDQPSNYGLNVKTVTDPTNIVSQPASPTVCNGFLGSIGVGYSGPTPAFQWQVLSAGTFTNILTGGNTAPLNYTATPGFQYYRCVMGTSCKNIISNTSTVTVNTLTVSTTFTNPTCFNSGNGSISASVTGGSGSYTYSWSPVGGTSATATGLYWNTYTLSVTDVMNGCIDTKT